MNRQQQAEALINPNGVFQEMMLRYEMGLFDRFINGEGEECYEIHARAQAAKELRTMILNEAGDIIDE